MIKIIEVAKQVARYWLLAIGCPPLEPPQSIEYCSKQQGCIDAKHDRIRISSNSTPQIFSCRKSYQLVGVRYSSSVAEALSLLGCYAMVIGKYSGTSFPLLSFSRINR
jgi:hypothetical protein